MILKPIKPGKPLDVEKLREILVQSGQDILVLVQWDSDTSYTTITTVGSNRTLADDAKLAGDKIAKALNITQFESLEDRRHEHEA